MRRLLSLVALTVVSVLSFAACGDGDKNKGDGGFDATVFQRLNEDDAIKVCVHAIACFSERFPTTTFYGLEKGRSMNKLDSCMQNWFEGLSPDERRCVLDAATNCTEVGKCLGFSKGTSCPKTNAPADVAYCDGTAIVKCASAGGGTFTREDCAVAHGNGATCAEDGMGGAFCTAGTCVAADPKKTCADERVSQCVPVADAGVTRRIFSTCTRRGLSCRTLGGNEAECAPTGDRCNVETSSSCDGPELRACVSSDLDLTSAVKTVHCDQAVIGRVCQRQVPPEKPIVDAGVRDGGADSGPSDAGAVDAATPQPKVTAVVACGFATDRECNPYDQYTNTLSCEGSTLVACVGGKNYRIDCATLGYGACNAIRGCVPK